MVADLIAAELLQLIPGSDHFFDELGGFLGEFGKDIVKDYMKEGLGTYAKEYQSRRFAARAEAARKRLKDETGLDPRPVSPAIAIPLMNAASMEDRPELEELWERLMAAAMNPKKSSQIRQVYIEILKKWTLSMG